MRNNSFMAGLLAVLLLVLSACSGEVIGVPQPRVSAEDSRVDSGRRLIASYGCGSCHRIPGVPGADALGAPPLDQFYKRTYIAGTLPNSEANLARWIQYPQQVVPGNAMPDLGVSEEEARDIAAYLYYQPPVFLWPNR